MKQQIAIVMLILLSASVTAAPVRYELRVDGLACPYCAYGIEKKIKALKGIDKDSLDIQLNEGLVVFVADTKPAYSKEKLKTLVNDAGFTLRGISTFDDPKTLQK